MLNLKRPIQLDWSNLSLFLLVPDKISPWILLKDFLNLRGLAQYW
jgi:hypothetical protein